MITKIDVSKALEVPGVKTILTYENAFDWITGMPPRSGCWISTCGLWATRWL